jgi:hypothetical protein
MARSEARLQFGLWRTGLDGHTSHAKLVYAVLLTEPTINQCGVGAVRTSRWARDASLTIVETDKALRELIAGDKILIDEDTEEVFVRTLIRNDGVAKQPYVLKGALREALQTTSPSIRRSLARELRKLPPKQPDGVSKTGAKVVYPDPHATADRLDPPPSPKPTQKAPETLFDSPQKGSETLHGGGGGGGTSSYVATQVEITTAARAEKRAPANPRPITKAAQDLAKAYYELVPLCSFPGIMKICKRALECGYEFEPIRAALVRLAEANRAVTFDSLRIEIDGPPVRAAPGDDRFRAGLALAARLEAEDDYRPAPPNLRALGGTA